MKLTSVELHPALSSNKIELSFKDPGRSNPFNVRAIVGLDADAISPMFYAGSIDGDAQFYEMSLEEKEIVLRMELNPRYHLGETPSSLRDKVYKIIGSSRTGQVQIRFLNEGDPICAISGFVTKVEAPLFEETNEVQVTVRCEDPMLRSIFRTEIDVLGLDPALTVITDDVSTAHHGFLFEAEILGDFDSFVIGDPDDDSWLFAVTPNGGFLTGDRLYLSSERDNRFIAMRRGGGDLYHIADLIVPGSVWPVIFPGTNKFVVGYPTLFEWTAISYYTTFWGV